MKPNERNNVHQQDIVVLDRGEYTSCTVNLHGATVTSWRIKNHEMIFVSRYTHFTGFSRILGGIQFVFPVIGPWEFGPKDGFARVLPWRVDEGPVRMDTGDVYAVVSLRDSPYTRSVWNFKFKLYYLITLREKQLAFDIRVENPSRLSKLEFIIMQHSLMRVSDITKCEIMGLKGCMYQDISRNKLLQDECDGVTISERFNRIYLEVPDEVIFKNTVRGGSLKVTKKIESKNINLWNPWIELFLTMDAAEGGDEYQYFIGVGAGIMSKTVCIEPLSCWSAFQMFEFVEPTQRVEKDILVKNFYDWFNGFC